jgi:hypothetical protein
MLAPNWYPGEKQLRQFAVACLPGFAAIGWMVHRVSHHAGPVAQNRVFQILVAVGAFFFLAGLAAPAIVRPVYMLLMAVTMPIGWLVSHIFLRIIFYAILTPLGLFFRMIGRDPLLLVKPTGNSYWQPHVQRADPLTYYRQS